MNRLILVCLLSFCFSCAQKKQMLTEKTEWQKKMNADFKDATKSPLTDKDRADFVSLDFFEFDSTFVVSAVLKRTPNSKWFKMKTTTSRVAEERVYGVLSFKINGKNYKLNIYQGKDLMKKPGYEDYLFLPFLDNTNGAGSYSGGRYLEARIPEGNELVIDFNKAYNPYCAYNMRYSCPIVPRENYIDLRVEAGVKDFKKH